MKLRAASIFILFFIIFIGRAQAQGTTTYDSLALNKIELAPGVDNPEYLLGVADGQEVHLSGQLQILARYFVNNSNLVLNHGSVLHVHWRRQSSFPDSNVGRIHLQRLTPDFIPYGDTSFDLNESLAPTTTPQMTTIIVPDTGFNAIGLECAADSGGNSFWIDAIVLIQHGTESVSDNHLSTTATVLASYPNPFLHSSSTTLRVTPPESGQAELSIRDMLGREVMQSQLGELSAGEQDIHIALDRPGVFFARLRLNGQWVGAPLKITSE